MKYLAFWEFCPEDLDKVIEKSVKSREEMKKSPGKFPEYIVPPHSIGGQMKGFSVVEATPEQIVNGVLYWHPELKIKYLPIIEASEFIEQRLKSK